MARKIWDVQDDSTNMFVRHRNMSTLTLSFFFALLDASERIYLALRVTWMTVTMC